MPKSVVFLMVLVIAGCGKGIGPSMSDSRLLRTTSKIQEELMEALPEGTAREEVASYFEGLNSKLTSSSEHAGFISQDGVALCEGHMRFHLGYYRFFLVTTDVTAIVGFDRSGRLCAIEVTKFRDAF